MTQAHLLWIATLGSLHEDRTRSGNCGGIIRSRTAHGADSLYKSAAQRQDDPTEPATGRAGTPRTPAHPTGEVSATDEAPKPPTNVVIRDSLGKVLDQYNKLSEI